MQAWFSRFARRSALVVGSSYCFIGTVVGILAWLACGPITGYSDTWQLWVNTTSTVITTLVVLLIQNTQNHDTEVIQCKLDELISVTAHARDKLVGIEDRTEEELEHVKAGFDRVTKKDG
jgi:low affinity Fe/Cu permease